MNALIILRTVKSISSVGLWSLHTFVIAISRDTNTTRVTLPIRTSLLPPRPVEAFLTPSEFLRQLSHLVFFTRIIDLACFSSVAARRREWRRLLFTAHRPEIEDSIISTRSFFPMAIHTDHVKRRTVSTGRRRENCSLVTIRNN